MDSCKNGISVFNKLGYAFVVPQKANANDVYNYNDGFNRGTIFKSLDIPYGKYGHEKVLKCVKNGGER